MHLAELTFFIYICSMEILYYIFAILLIIALFALLVVPIWYGIKQARNKSNDSKTTVINIVITEESNP